MLSSEDLNGIVAKIKTQGLSGPTFTSNGKCVQLRGKNHGKLSKGKRNAIRYQVSQILHGSPSRAMRPQPARKVFDLWENRQRFHLYYWW